MKLKFKAKLGPMDHYRLDQEVHKVGAVFEIDEERGKAILASHPKSFEDVTPKGKASRAGE